MDSGHSPTIPMCEDSPGGKGAGVPGWTDAALVPGELTGTRFWAEVPLGCVYMCVCVGGGHIQKPQQEWAREESSLEGGEGPPRKRFCEGPEAPDQVRTEGPVGRVDPELWLNRSGSPGILREVDVCSL